MARFVHPPIGDISLKWRFSLGRTGGSIVTHWQIFQNAHPSGAWGAHALNLGEIQIEELRFGERLNLQRGLRDLLLLCQERRTKTPARNLE